MTVTALPTTQLPRPTCVIFDLDGLLVDSEPYWRNGFRAGLTVMASRLDRPTPALTAGTLLHYEGGRVPDTLVRLCEDYLGVTPRPPLLDLAVKATIASASTQMLFTPTPIIEAVETARRLHSEGYLLAVASSSAKPFILATLDAIGLTGYFPVIESAFDLDHGKPHPEVYLNAVKALGAEPHNCIALEDSKTGVESALRAGLRTVWVKTGADPTFMASPDRPALHVVETLSMAAVCGTERLVDAPHTLSA